jgi:SSS family solute:Na+ symporter
MLTPAALFYILPKGLLGAFAGVVLFAFISTHDTYLLAWGSIFIQDVVIPIKGKPLSPKQHLKWIRGSVIAVAVFILLFSTFFKQVDNIYMFFDISASLYIGAAGVVLLGGLYWKRGTTTAAWVTMVVGAILSVSGLIYRSINPEFLNGRIMAFWVALICIFLYVVTSYLGRKPDIDFDRILNRDKAEEKKKKWWKWKAEVPKSDRIIIPCMVISIAIFLITFVSVWIYNLVYDVPVTSWVKFWHVYLYLMFFGGSAFLLWIIIGGIRDLIRLFKNLRSQEENILDDGSVVRDSY